jgi:hypothetical protein
MASAREVDKLSLKDGDVLLFRPKTFGPDSAQRYSEEAKLIRNHLWSHGIDGVLIMVLAPETDVQTADEAWMNEHGWYRKAIEAETEPEPDEDE